MIIDQVPDAFIFMKVGTHAGESLEQILERKQQEYDRTGRIFWGYGGSVAHPITQVQPFARQQVQQVGSIYLLMEYIDSKADPELVPASQYSVDGVEWEDIPDGIHVTGSRYALVLDQIMPGDLEIPTDKFVVGIGPSRGKGAREYLKGRVDKGCLTRGIVETATDEDVEAAVKKADYVAKLKEPFAVLLR